MKKKFFYLFLLSLFTSVSTMNAQSISGAGATFPQPFYNTAFISYSKMSGHKVSYGGIGSGGGIRSLKDKVVDFGASDAFLSNEDLKNMPASIVHIPTCSGAVVVAFNLIGINELKLNPTVLADIFMGKIKNWNSSEIKKLNPSIKLPNKEITVVHRSDGSGTTNMFTDYLSKVNKEWKDKIGSGKSVKWLTGIGAKGNPGVSGTISQTIGSIGYVGSEYAFAQQISSALLQNKSGNFIKASISSVSAAGKGEIPSDTRIMLTNSSAPDAYPIAGFTWIILYKEQNYNNRSYNQAKATLDLIKWITTPKGQNYATKTNYAPLPTKVVSRVNEILKTITYNGKVILN